MIDETNYKIQETEEGCKELHIEPASYVLNDDSHAFLPPSKALVLGLLPLVSVGVFYSGALDGVLTVDTPYETHELSLPLAVAAPFVIKPSSDNALILDESSVETSQPILTISDQKPAIGAQYFHRKHKTFGIKNVLAKEVSTAIKKPLTKPPLLRKMEQQRAHLQQKTMLSNITREKGRQKNKVTFLASKASMVRLVSSKPPKKVSPMGVLNIRSRLMNEQGRVVKASYFVIQQGKRVKQKEKAQSAMFKLPIGEYIIQAIYNGKVMEKKAVVEKAHVDQLTFIYLDKKQSSRSSPVAKVLSNNAEKKTVHTGKIVVMSHDEKGRGKVLPADYFVYKNGQEVLHKSRSSVTDFRLPAGDYILRAVRSSEGRAVIREMAIAVESGSVVFPIFVFDESDTRLKTKKVGKLEKRGKVIQGDDLKILAEIVLDNEGLHQYASASSDSLKRISKDVLPTSIGYSRKKL